MRAEEMQVPVAVGSAPVGRTPLPPRVKPAQWGEDGDHWTAETPGVALMALPDGAESRGGRVYFPKSRYPDQQSARAALGGLYPGLKDAAANPDGTYNLYNAELFTEGKWNGDTYTPDDIREIVRAYAEVGHIMKPWGKLGHDDAQTYAESAGLPRAGNITNLSANVEPHPDTGTPRMVLRGDIRDIPPGLFDAISQKGYTVRSPEIYWNYAAANGKTYPRALRAVALLGAEMPGNPTMSELYRTYRASDGEVRVYSEFDSASENAPAPAAPDAPTPDHALDTITKARAGDLVPGLAVRLTHLRGQTRTGIRTDGQPWQAVMRHDYGEIPGIPGLDGEPLDAYVGGDPSQAHAFMVTQLKPDGSLDEEKAMLGFPGMRDARAAYLAHAPTPDVLGGIRRVPLSDLIDRQRPPSAEASTEALDRAAAPDPDGDVRAALARIRANARVPLTTTKENL